MEGQGGIIDAKPEDIADAEQEGTANSDRGGIVAVGVGSIAGIETDGSVEAKPEAMASTSMTISFKSVFFPFCSSFVRPAVTFEAEVNSTSGVTPGVSVEVLASLTD